MVLLFGYVVWVNWYIVIVNGWVYVVDVCVVDDEKLYGEVDCSVGCRFDEVEFVWSGVCVVYCFDIWLCMWIYGCC